MPGNPSAPKRSRAPRRSAGERAGPENKHNSIIEVENFALTMWDGVIASFEVAHSPNSGIDVRVTDRVRG